MFGCAPQRQEKNSLVTHKKEMRPTVLIVDILSIAVISTLVLLPVLHELGHYIVGLSMGAVVNYIKLLPPKPHVSFRFTSSEALPWVCAGGLSFPSLAACVTVPAWFAVKMKANVHMSLLLWIPSIVLLAGNLGLFFEVTKPRDLNYHHLLFLGESFGLSGGALVMFQIVPALLPLGIIVLLIAKPKRRNARVQPDVSDPGSTDSLLPGS